MGLRWLADKGNLLLAFVKALSAHCVRANVAETLPLISIVHRSIVLAIIRRLLTA